MFKILMFPANGQVSDQAYIINSAGRLCRALFEIVFRDKGWVTLAMQLLDLTKALDRRVWCVVDLVCFVYTCRRLIYLSLCFAYTCRRLIDLSLLCIYMPALDRSLSLPAGITHTPTLWRSSGMYAG